MARKLYGIPGSRALRSIWAIEEVGVDYEHVPTHFATDTKTPEYLKINPNGRIPTLVDGELTLFESMAINLYLARTYGGDLYPSGPRDQALTEQWSFWGMTEIEPPLLQMVLHKFMLPENERSPEAITKAEADLQKPLQVLDDALAGRDTLLGDHFGIADLNVASVLSMSAFVGVDVSGFKNVKRWLDACLGRPSFAAAQKKGT